MGVAEPDMIEISVLSQNKCFGINIDKGRVCCYELSNKMILNWGVHLQCSADQYAHILRSVSVSDSGNAIVYCLYNKYYIVGKNNSSPVIIDPGITTADEYIESGVYQLTFNDRYIIFIGNKNTSGYLLVFDVVLNKLTDQFKFEGEFTNGELISYSEESRFILLNHGLLGEYIAAAWSIVEGKLVSAAFKIHKSDIAGELGFEDICVKKTKILFKDEYDVLYEFNLLTGQAIGFYNKTDLLLAGNTDLTENDMHDPDYDFEQVWSEYDKNGLISVRYENLIYSDDELMMRYFNYLFEFDANHHKIKIVEHSIAEPIPWNSRGAPHLTDTDI